MGLTAYKEELKAAMGGLKDEGVDAFADVTHLRGRSPGDKELTAMHHRRLSIHELSCG